MTYDNEMNEKKCWLMNGCKTYTTIADNEKNYRILNENGLLRGLMFYHVVVKVVMRCELPSVFSVPSANAIPLLDPSQSLLDCASFQYDPNAILINPPFVRDGLEDEIFYVVPSQSAATTYQSSFSIPLRFVPSELASVIRDCVSCCVISIMYSHIFLLHRR